MTQLVARAFVSVSVLSLLPAFGHSAQIVPKTSQVAASSHRRHIRGASIVDSASSRSWYNAIHANSGSGTPDQGVQPLVDFGSGKDSGGGGLVASSECTDRSDQCPVSACDPNEPDCVIQLAALGGKAQPGDVCGTRSKPIGSPLKARGPNGITERVGDITYIMAYFPNQSWPIGYVYVSDVTGKTFFQPNVTMGAGAGAVVTISGAPIEPPYVAMGNITATEISKALKTSLDFAKLLGFAVNPAAYNVIKGGTLAAAPCFTVPHGPVWT